jgi:hypothetical protein
MLWSPYTYLTLLLVAVLAYVFWHRNLACRELANRIASETCGEAQVQLLDGTVAFSSFGAGRDAGGRWIMRRNYVFDYTDNGVNRHQGFVVLRGLNLEAVGLAPVVHH